MTDAWSTTIASVVACGPTLGGLDGAARGILTIAFIAGMGLLITGRGRELLILAPVAIALMALAAAL